MKIDLEDFSSQKPNGNNALLYGTQYSANFFSYLDFCRAMADKEEMKEYVLVNFDEVDTRSPVNKTDGASGKPVESYALMIYKALEDSSEGKLTLSEIYAWIESTYPYYRKADPVWKNSIRHNLSLNPTFKKVPRPQNCKGKGGFWAIDDSQRHGKLLKKSRRQKSCDRASITSDLLGITAGKMIF